MRTGTVDSHYWHKIIILSIAKIVNVHYLVVSTWIKSLIYITADFLRKMPNV